MKNGKAMFLAYDHGLEHGPIEFNDKDANPEYIIDIAKKGKYNALIFQKGIAEKYNEKIKKSKIPLIIKLNGKTNLFQGEPVSRQICSVKEALDLGAKAVGYTIYIGSRYESVMLKEFDSIEEEAHAKGIPVIAWIYPRGKSVEKKPGGELMAYAARTGLEIGADIIKIKYNGNVKDLKWAVKVAGKTQVMIAGGVHEDEKIFLKQVKEIINAGAAGLAVGRNIWQSGNPVELSGKIKRMIWD
ncbi:MAG: fructose-bisphosphate aldolase [Candidatus Pacearchaeota archaeon]|nr:fructose-bisphosphate aldolase [Candidatus Pacearchaeota archaeon]MDE1848478.1 fructose-bisphosphate aldolase [Nanoarchaeota archaeon]